MGVTRSLSNIIKGQRVRSESIYQIKSPAPKEKTKDLVTDTSGQKEAMKNQMEKIESKANRLKEEAIEEGKAKAALLIQEGQEQIKRESALALEQAKEEGYMAGYNEGKLEADSLIAEGKQILSEAKIEKNQLLARAEPEVVEMIIKICQKLIDQEIKFNKDTILVLIKKTLGQIRSDTLDVNIKVSPDNYDYVVENEALIIEEFNTPEKILILKDSKIAKGACIIETPFGSIESNINEAFSEIKKQMRLIYKQK